MQYIQYYTISFIEPHIQHHPSSTRAHTKMPFSKIKKIQAKRKRQKFFIYSVCSAKWNMLGNPLRMIKKSLEFCSEPFCRREKHWEPIPNHSAESKNAQNSALNYFAEEKNT